MEILINRFDSKGLKDGLWIEFHTNGNIKDKAHYLKDKKNGGHSYLL